MPPIPTQTIHPTAHNHADSHAPSPQATQQQILGCLWGLALGDAVGLPREGITPQRATRLFGGGPLEHGLLGRYGMISDDTEHHCMTAQAWLAAQGDPKRFGRSLAWRLRGWLLGLPAGVGFATLRAILKLWLGFSPTRSGVHSAGNGPAMRAPILGLLCNDLDQLRHFIQISTRLTHTDPQAEAGAFLIACATRLHAGLLLPSTTSKQTTETPSNTETSPIADALSTVNIPSNTQTATLTETPSTADALSTEDKQRPVDACEQLDQLLPYVEGDVLRAALLTVREHLAKNAEASEVAEALGLQRGVTGYINHTVPIAIFCWLRHRGNFRAAVESAIKLGGDTDTVAAIVGGIAGANTSPDHLPSTWRDGICDRPRSLAWMEQLAHALAQHDKPVALAWPLLPLRNAFFLCVVLLHGLRRLFPPY